MSTQEEIDALPPAMSLPLLIVMLLAVVAGAFAAAVVLPNWLPGLSQSLLGSEPKAYWYLSRASALVAYTLVWVSMATGLIITNKLARLWPGGPIAFDLHQYTSLLGLAFGLFHALILIGDKYINYTLAQILIPFNSVGYKPDLGGHRAGWVLFAGDRQSQFLCSQTPRSSHVAAHSLSQFCVAGVGVGSRHSKRH